MRMGEASTHTQTAEKAAILSREFVHRFWQGDAAWCLNVTSPDFVWVGARAGQFDLGADDLGRACRALADDGMHVVLMDEVYRVLPSSDDPVTTVLCQYRCRTRPDSPMVFSTLRRATFVWRMLPEGLRLTHCHESGAAFDVKSSDAPEGEFVDESSRYLMQLSQQAAFNSGCNLRDVYGNVRVTRLVDVMYLEAQRQCTVVHCAKGSFRIRGGITKTAAQLDPQGTGTLLTVHRSYVVNALYVDSVGGADVLLANGAKLPLSSRRRCAVIAELAELRRA